MNGFTLYASNDNATEEEMYGHFLDIEQQTTLTQRIIIRQHKGGYVVSQTDLASIQTEPMRMFRNVVPLNPPTLPGQNNGKSSPYPDQNKTHIYEDKYVFVVSKISVLRYTAVCIVSALFGCASAILAATAKAE